MVKVGLIIMIDKKFLAITVGAVFVLGMYGPNVADIVQSAEAHGVQAQLQSRFIQITNEAISRQSLSTGETLVLSGTLVSLVEREQPGVYHVLTQLNVANVGPGLGPGTTVVVEGDPIIKPIPWGMLAYQSIMIAAAYVVTFATRPWQVI